ncbi:MAG: hypothetical protein VCB42_03365 [Myxococcota bacterium]
MTTRTRQTASRDRAPGYRWVVLVLAVLVAVVVTSPTGCASSPDSRSASNSLPEAPGQTRAQRLLALDRAIEADYDRLLELIVEPTRVDSVPLRENPELLAIAERLPRLQAERQRLETEMSGQEPAPGGES